MPGNKKFDLDLSFGEFHEERLAEILTGKIEVKTDRMAFRTGNLAVEFECNGKPSGIMATESDHWAFNILDEKGDVAMTLLLPIERLIAICNSGQCRWVSGGDRNAARMFLLPMEQIYSIMLGA